MGGRLDHKKLDHEKHEKNIVKDTKKSVESERQKALKPRMNTDEHGWEWFGEYVVRLK